MPTVYTPLRATRPAGIYALTHPFDANDLASETGPVQAYDKSLLSLRVGGDHGSGSHTTHVVRLLGSMNPDGPWENTPTTLQGVGHVEIVPTWPYYKAKLATAQGAASIVTVAMVAYRD